MVDADQPLVGAARTRFGCLSPAEERFFRAVAVGEIADYTPTGQSRSGVENAASWGADRTLQADRISWLCWNPTGSGLVTVRGVRVRGVKIEGRLDLEFARLPFPLVAIECWIPAGLCLRTAEIPMLSLHGTHTGPIDADRLVTARGLFMRGGFRSSGEVRLVGLCPEGCGLWSARLPANRLTYPPPFGGEQLRWSV